MGKDVEEVAASLVREYLSRKGLKKTIACMDQELPRTPLSITNRSDLRMVLHLESLCKKNKAEEHPLKTMLEMIVKDRLSGNGCKVVYKTEQIISGSSPNTPETVMEKGGQQSSFPENTRTSQTVPPRHRSFEEAHETLQSSIVSSDNSPGSENSVAVVKEAFLSQKASLDIDGWRNRNSRIRRGIMAGPITCSSQELNRRRSARKATSELCREEENCTNSLLARSDPADGESSISSSHLQSGNMECNAFMTPAAKPQHRPKVLDHSLKLDDVDELEMTLDELLQSPCDVPPTFLPQQRFSRTKMDQKTAIALKELIFGSAMACFSEEWKQQSFTFSNYPGLKYGIVQKKGGPCGVLAAVQACVLQRLLFDQSHGGSADERLEVPNRLRTKCLLQALSDILWRAGDMKRATVVLSTGRVSFTPVGRYRSDGVLEETSHVTVETLPDLQVLLEQNVRQFESGPFGCILLVVSALLTRTVKTVQSDMDMPSSNLIGAHGYCTQELVNLLLCGRAVSNVFDDELKLDSGNGVLTLLKGMKAQCDVGLLSLFEHYNICKVGSYLKSPKFPIWLVCSESHFTVLFCLAEDCDEEEFDMFYYDGLANQQDPIRLTIHPHSAALSAQNGNTDDDDVPPLELCIRTKWRNATVRWNDTEPIL